VSWTFKKTFEHTNYIFHSLQSVQQLFCLHSDTAIKKFHTYLHQNSWPLRGWKRNFMHEMRNVSRRKKMIWFSRNKLKPFYLKTKITNNIKMVHACSEDQKQRASKSHRANVTFRTYLSSSDNQNGRLDHDSDWKLV